jgi:hypothetical protein
MKNVQSVIFLRSAFSVAKARAWLKAHNYKYGGKVDTTLRYHRFRQLPPSTYPRYRIRSIGNGHVKLVLGYDS